MKIGLSLSRCVLDLVEKKIDPDDVLVIVSGTDFDPTVDEEWESIWRGYKNYTWSDWVDVENASDKFRSTVLELWFDGKLHQPRKFGAHHRSRDDHWLEASLPSSEIDKNHAVKKAWERFQIVAGLVNIKQK